METVAVLGSGGWGTAIAKLLCERGTRVRLWCAHAETCLLLKKERRNERQLPGIPLPAELEIVDSPTEAVAGASCWVSAIPTKYLRETIEKFQNLARRETLVVSLTKGIEQSTFLRPTEILEQMLGVRRTVVLSGPSHAEEVARGMPTSLVAASSDASDSAWVQSHFGSERFRIYTNTDVIGVELAGALKNVVGIAAGCCDGLGFGDNAKAALLTRGLVEMTRFGVAHGAEPATFGGLAGLGDLITTCFSPHGRNRRVGERLARGESLADVMSGPQIAEGITTARSVVDRIHTMKLELPIMEAVYRTLYEGVAPLEAVRELMSRRQRGELG